LVLDGGQGALRESAQGGAVFPFKRKKQDDEPVDLEARSAQLGIKNKDLQLLGQLMAQGADLTKPRHALYYLYFFASRDAADTGVDKGRAAGYGCNVREPLPEHPDQWSLVCERPDAALDPAGVIASDNFFQGIADRLGGEFGGWEAAATP
jgi:regulator of ribonuclease activity B